MRGMPTDFWGKIVLGAEEQPVEWLPLEHHCADVAACFDTLLDQPVIKQRLACLGGLPWLTEGQHSRLSVLAALHDLGKYNIGFQNKAWGGRRKCSGHVKPLLSLFDGLPRKETRHFWSAIWGNDIEVWGETAFQYLIASICHHGKPTSLGSGFSSEIWKQDGDLIPFEGMRRLAKLVRRWFPGAFAEGGLPLPNKPAMHHAFSGLVTLADWIASDQDFFPFDVSSVQAGGSRFWWAKEHARNTVFPMMGLDTTGARNCLIAHGFEFERVFGVPPYESQEQISLLTVNNGGEISILESETGSGKTEGALARFLVLYEQKKVDGMYFALPTRTAATQIYHRVCRAVEKAFPDENVRPPVVLAVPGYLMVDEQKGHRLPGFEVLWADEEEERWKFRGWAAEHSKRYLAGSIVVGTIDQALLSALAVNHSHLRASSLLRQFLVVDEVHASDTYMNRILGKVVRRHVEAGGHVLLMSATLGSVARDAFLKGKPVFTIPTIDDACKIPYPLISHRSPDSLETIHVLSSKYRKNVKIQLEEGLEDWEWISIQALEKASAGARVLIIRNTVRDCLLTQMALELVAKKQNREHLLFAVDGIPVAHHSRFSKEDRRTLDETIEKYFGKGIEGGGCVAVATQTVQQSLDIDADVMITDLCPMDVLLQRIGRLHRHSSRKRPIGFETPQLTVLVPDTQDLGHLINKKGGANGRHGFGPVYEDLRILEATWRELKKRSVLKLPADNRELVEKTTHPEALLQLVNDLGGRWIIHAQKMTQEIQRDRVTADLNLSNWDVLFDSPDCLFPPTSETIKSRLGEGDRLARFFPPVQGPFGEIFRSLSIPFFLCEGIKADDTVQILKQGKTWFVFSWGPQVFSYDRLGLRKLEE